MGKPISPNTDRGRYISLSLSHHFIQMHVLTSRTVNVRCQKILTLCLWIFGYPFLGTKSTPFLFKMYVTSLGLWESQESGRRCMKGQQQLAHLAVLLQDASRHGPKIKALNITQLGSTGMYCLNLSMQIFLYLLTKNMFHIYSK